VVLSARNLPTPTAKEVLDLVSENPIGQSMGDWISKDPLWGRVANVIFYAGECAHVTHDVDADCLGALATLNACIEFLVALHAEDSGL
jgi:hypothetical protein